MIWAKANLYAFISSLLYPVVLAMFLFNIAYGFLWFDEPLSKQKPLYLALAGVASLSWATLLYRRYRLIEDTGSTTLNSASQGYSELQGEAALYDGEIARSLHYEVPPMVWFRTLFRTSWNGFLLKDGRDQCTIDPRNAEVITPIYKYNQYIYNAIYPGETIYALGELETVKKHRTEWERKGLTSQKLADWKRLKFKFLDYFDANKDGKIDDAELNVAKLAAEREVDHDLEDSYRLPATHIVARPADGRPFILSSIHPDKLVSRYKIATIIHFSLWLVLSMFALLLN